jgi:hypothetical protein
MGKKTAPKKTAPVEEQDIVLDETEEETETETETETEEEEEQEEAADENEDADDAPKKTAKAPAKDAVIFVNKEKLSRAKDIVLLITAKRAPRETSEFERKEHYTGLLAAKGVKATDPKAVQAIYEILGGLVRTPEEQATADKKAAAAKAKSSKRKIEGDK